MFANIREGSVFEKIKSRKRMLAFLLLGIIVLTAVAMASTEISDCTNLDTPGETYLLTTDITHLSDTNCMYVQANDVTLDCQGHTIDGNFTYALGISGAELTNMTIRNCSFINWGEGVWINHMDNIQILDSNFSSNGYGIDLEYSDNDIISNCRVEDSLNEGMYLRATSNITVANSTFTNNFEAYSINAGVEGIIYNNIFNSTSLSLNTETLLWNITQQAGTRIYGAGTDIGGNYYTNPSSNGYSDTCLDANADGFCDSAYTIASGNVDYLSLSNFYNDSNAISDCSTLDRASRTYYLTSDILNSPTAICIDIQADNVILNCQGHIINGQDTYGTNGVSSAFANTTVENCILTDWQNGIYISYTSGATLFNNTATSNNDGIALDTDTDSTAYNNTLNGNYEAGISFWAGSNNSIYNNLLNNTPTNINIQGEISNYFNTTKQAGTPIYGPSSYIGGNYYTNPSGTGYSDTCEPNTDGFCVEPYPISGSDYDYLPLSNKVAIEISDCATLDQVGRFYMLTSDILDTTSDPCISIEANDITLDCQGYAVYKGSYVGYPALIGATSRNITIKNCIAIGGHNSILMSGVDGFTIDNCTTYDTNSGGYEGFTFVIAGSSNGVVENSNSYNGTFLLSVDQNVTVRNVTFSREGGGSEMQIWADVGGNTIANNTFTTGVDSAFYVNPSTLNYDLFYNNYFGSPISFYISGDLNATDWNTTQQEGIRIFGAGTDIGGNYYDWFSGTCTDANVDGICDSPYDILTQTACTAGVDCSIWTDYLPLSNQYLPNTISDCAVLDQAGATYTLTSNIIDSSASICMDIQSDNITLDCRGNMIDGQDSGGTYGVFAQRDDSTVTNITIKNCSVSDWQEGIFFINAGNNSIYNNTANSNNIGIYFEAGSNNNSVYNNTVSNNSDRGFYLYSSSSNQIYNNIVDDNIWYGFLLEESSSNNLIYNNTVSNGDGGFYINSNSGDSIYDNIISSNNYGFGIASSSDNSIYNNFLNNSLNVYLEGDIYLNNWNTTQQSGTRIFNNGADIGGNYWADPSGTGYSETCIDVGGTGFCDQPYDVQNNVACTVGVDCSDNTDYLPMSNNASTIGISSCAVLDQEGMTYLLTSDIDDSSTPPYQACINITANNIVLDCQSHMMTGPRGRGPVTYTSAIDVWRDTPESTGVTIKNCEIYGYQAGVRLFGASDNSLDNLTIGVYARDSDRISYSVWIGSDSSRNNVTNSYINGSYGILLGNGEYPWSYTTGGNNDNIFENLTFNSLVDDVLIANAPEDIPEELCRQTFTNDVGGNGAAPTYYPFVFVNESYSTIENEQLSELILCNADYSIVNNISIIHNGYSPVGQGVGMIFGYAVDYSNFTNNNLSYVNEGFWLNGGTYNNIANNYFEYGNYGLDLETTSSYNNITSNMIYSLVYEGVYEWNSGHNIFDSNIINGSLPDSGVIGFDAGSPNDIFTNNLVTDLTPSDTWGGFGFYIVDNYNSTFIGNNVTNCQKGFQFDSYGTPSDNLTFINNIADSNTQYATGDNDGFDLYYCPTNSLFENNIATNNLDAGFEMTITADTNGTTFTNNDASNNRWGFIISAGNTTLINNTANNDIYQGFLVQQSNNNRLTGNSVDNSSGNEAYAITLADYNVLVNNTASGSNAYRGMALYGANYNQIIGTNITINWVAAQGIMLSDAGSGGSSYNLIANNTITGTYGGPGLWLIDNSNNNNVTGNYISNNVVSGWGFVIESSSNNIVNDNTIIGWDNGFVLGSYPDGTNWGPAENNQIYNNLINSTSGFYIYGDYYPLNTWNTTQQAGARIYSTGTDIGGNYYTTPSIDGYSDTCDDINHDGFCDTPLDICYGGCEGNLTDYLPLSSNYSSGGTCGLSLDSNTLDFGSLKAGNISVQDANYVVVTNDGTIAGDVIINATTWTSSLNNFNAEYSHYYNDTSKTYAEKTEITNDPTIVYTALGSSGYFNLYIDVKAGEASQPVGIYDQTVDITGSC